MDQDGADFGDTLAEAQRLGYAEADPTNDVEGIDAAYKLAILASLGFRARVRGYGRISRGHNPADGPRLSVRSRAWLRHQAAGIASIDRDGVQVRVHPALVHQDAMIAKVNGVLNAVEIQTDLAGKLLFHGAGAGAMPTTSAVVADLVDIARNLAGDVVPPPIQPLSEDIRVRPIAELQTRYYVRLTAADRPGVLAQVGSVLAERNISIASAIQKETYEVSQRAEIVLMTHRANEEAMQQAIREFESLETVVEVGNVIRVEEW